MIISQQLAPIDVDFPCDPKISLNEVASRIAETIYSDYPGNQRNRVDKVAAAKKEIVDDLRAAIGFRKIHIYRYSWVGNCDDDLKKSFVDPEFLESSSIVKYLNERKRFTPKIRSELRANPSLEGWIKSIGPENIREFQYGLQRINRDSLRYFMDGASILGIKRTIEVSEAKDENLSVSSLRNDIPHEISKPKADEFLKATRENNISEIQKNAFNNYKSDTTTNLRINEVCDRLKIGRSTIYDWINPKSPRYKKDFPKGALISERVRAWRESDIEAWLERKHT